MFGLSDYFVFIAEGKLVHGLIEIVYINVLLFSIACSFVCDRLQHVCHLLHSLLFMYNIILYFWFFDASSTIGLLFLLWPHQLQIVSNLFLSSLRLTEYIALLVYSMISYVSVSTVCKLRHVVFAFERI